MRAFSNPMLLALAMGLAVCGPVHAAEPAQDAAHVEAVVQGYLQNASEAAAKAVADELLRDPNTPIIGNPKGDVTLVAFFDYQCPYCKAAEPRILQMLKDDGRIRLVLKEFPILGPQSRVAARAALAAQNQGKYEAFHLALFANRGRLTNEAIFSIAKSVGLDIDRLKKDMNAPEIADRIIANMALARALKISFTPAYIVNSKVLSGISANTETAKINFPDEIALARKRAP